jgi:CheY-like chemotaxis protein
MISDIGMPDLDGYAPMRCVRSRGQTLPAIALTAYARREDIDQVKGAGYQEHLAKPVDARRLVETVQMLVPLRSSEKLPIDPPERSTPQPPRVGWRR